MCGKDSIIKTKEKFYVLPNDAFMKLFFELYFNTNNNNRLEYEDLMAACVLQAVFLNIHSSKKKDNLFESPFSGFDGTNIKINSKTSSDISMFSKYTNGLVPLEDFKKIYIGSGLISAGVDPSSPTTVMEKLKQRLDMNPLCTLDVLF